MSFVSVCTSTGKDRLSFQKRKNWTFVDFVLFQDTMTELPYKLSLEEAELRHLLSESKDWMWSHGRSLALAQKPWMKSESYLFTFQSRKFLMLPKKEVFLFFSPGRVSRECLLKCRGALRSGGQITKFCGVRNFLPQTLFWIGAERARLSSWCALKNKKKKPDGTAHVQNLTTPRNCQHSLRHKVFVLPLDVKRAFLISYLLQLAVQECWWEKETRQMKWRTPRLFCCPRLSWRNVSTRLVKCSGMLLFCSTVWPMTTTFWKQRYRSKWIFRRAAWACSMRSALSAITIVYVCVNLDSNRGWGGNWIQYFASTSEQCTIISPTPGSRFKQGGGDNWIW